MQYFSENDTVAVMEENAYFFRVYHADSMHLKRQYDIKVRPYIGLVTSIKKVGGFNCQKTLLKANLHLAVYYIQRTRPPTRGRHRMGTQWRGK